MSGIPPELEVEIVVAHTSYVPEENLEEPVPGGMEEEDAGLFECGICFLEVEVAEKVCCQMDHAFCSDCVRNHAREAAYGQGKSALLDCLEVGCDSGFRRSMGPFLL